MFTASRRTMYWCTNCQGYRSPASDICNNSCDRNCYNRCSGCQKYTLIKADSELAKQQSHLKFQTQEMIRSASEFGGSIECKIEDRRPDGSIYRTTTWTYTAPPK